MDQNKLRHISKAITWRIIASTTTFLLALAFFGDDAQAIKKATDDAKKNMVKVPMKEGRTLHHDMKGHYGAGRVVLRSAPSGTGIIAGGPMRAVFETLGVQDVVAKSIGTSNPHNMIKATFDAFNSMNSPRNIASKRGKKVAEIFGKK